MTNREHDPSGGGIALTLTVAVVPSLLLGAARALLGHFESALVLVALAIVDGLLVTWLTRA